MFIGEGPGREEDLQGRPFVGPAGQLLDKMLAAIGMERGEVYIANIVKCRPPQNRVPTDEEAQACLPYLRAQTGLIKPRIIVCLGATAAMYVYDPNVRITRERGIWKEKKGVWILPTYHPAALLRDPDKKREAWADMQALRAKREELLPGGAVQASL
jgi:DNA polymerase